MKTKITLGLMMAIFMMPIAYTHAGVGVGNGGEGDHAAALPVVQPPVPGPALHGDRPRDHAEGG